MMKVIVAGAGPGALELYTGKTIEAIKDADIVLTSFRFNEDLERWNQNVRVMGVMDTVHFLNENHEKQMTVCVIASGDTGFYSIASTIQKNIHSDIELKFLSGIGSLQYFASKIRTSYEDMKLISLHGREKSIVPYVCYHEKVFALTGGQIKVQDVVKSLIDAGLTDVTVYVGEKLTMPEERIVSGQPADLLSETFDDLAVIIVHNKDYVNRYRTLKDEDFVRGNSPMTKEAVRSLSVAALEIKPTDIVYDIGAGTGSVTCAMALKACESMVWAVEKEEEAVGLVKENMKKTGARNIIIQRAAAPDGLKDFPPADKVFIGGSSGNMQEIVRAILAKNENAVFAVTAVTLETISQTVELFEELKLNPEVICVNVSAAQKLGRYHLMKAENPIYLIKGAAQLEK